MQVLFISTWPPDKCGIASFTNDLAQGISVSHPDVVWSVVALAPQNKDFEYGPKVVLNIKRQEVSSYDEAIKYINLSKESIVCIQHEFGIYGGTQGSYILKLLEGIRKPKVTVLHNPLQTNLPNIYTNSRIKLALEIIGKSDKVVVMNQITKNSLVNFHGIDAGKLEVIPHGVPNFLFSKPKSESKILSRFKGRDIIAAWGIMTIRKGYEYIIMAMKEIVRTHPNAILIISGKVNDTPEIKSYSHYLKTLTQNLNLEEFVYFEEDFLSEKEFNAFLHEVDIFITPYSILDHGSSGSLLFAMAAGKPVVSTPFVAAQEVLTPERGLLIPFTDRKAIIEAVVDLLDHPDKAREIGNNARNYVKHYKWHIVVSKYIDLFKEVSI